MLADILGEHLQSKHYHVIPQSITLPVVIFIIHALWSRSLCCKRGSKLGWLNFRVESCFISRPKPQVYSSGRCWTFLVMDALRVFGTPRRPERQSRSWDPAEVRAGWKCRSEGRVMAKQGWNQEPLCRLGTKRAAWPQITEPSTTKRFISVIPPPERREDSLPT